MRSIKEILVDESYNRYLLDDLALWVQCYWNCGSVPLVENYMPLIFESKGYFDNCGKAVNRIYNEIKSSSENKLSIDCKDLNVFFEIANIEILSHKSSGIVGQYASCTQTEVSIEILLNKNNDDCYKNLEYTLLHELIHAYEDWNRITNKRPSIFTEYNREYKMAFTAMQREDKEFIEHKLASCKYLLNSKERNAYLGTLEKTLKNVIKDVNPKWINLKFDEVLDKIKDEYIWKEYFELNKFILTFDEYDKNYIRKKYNNLYCLISNKKSYSEIKKEIMSQWKIFKAKFEQLFAKIYCDMVLELHEGAMPSVSSFNKIYETL